MEKWWRGFGVHGDGSVDFVDIDNNLSESRAVGIVVHRRNFTKFSKNAMFDMKSTDPTVLRLKYDERMMSE